MYLFREEEFVLSSKSPRQWAKGGAGGVYIASLRFHYVEKKRQLKFSYLLNLYFLMARATSYFLDRLSPLSLSLSCEFISLPSSASFGSLAVSL